jgi:hypothetical protein
VRGVREILMIVKPVERLLAGTSVVPDPDLARFLARATATVVYALVGTSLLGTLVSRVADAPSGLLRRSRQSRFFLSEAPGT